MNLYLHSTYMPGTYACVAFLQYKINKDSSLIVTGFAKTIIIDTTTEIHLMLNIKATLSYCPGTPST